MSFAEVKFCYMSTVDLGRDTRVRLGQCVHVRLTDVAQSEIHEAEHAATIPPTTWHRVTFLTFSKQKPKPTRYHSLLL
jgi:hypothetical protein